MDYVTVGVSIRIFGSNSDTGLVLGSDYLLNLSLMLPIFALDLNRTTSCRLYGGLRRGQGLSVHLHISLTLGS